jgi:hypothetical protein
VDSLTPKMLSREQLNKEEVLPGLSMLIIRNLLVGFFYSSLKKSSTGKAFSYSEKLRASYGIPLRSPLEVSKKRKSVREKKHLGLI